MQRKNLKRVDIEVIEAADDTTFIVKRKSRKSFLIYPEDRLKHYWEFAIGM